MWFAKISRKLGTHDGAKNKNKKKKKNQQTNVRKNSRLNNEHGCSRNE
jgi:hypothetical protein